MDFSNYVSPELLVLIPVLYGLGSVIKKTEDVKDNYIPVILTVVGVILSCLYVFGTEGFNLVSLFTSLAQGILVAAGAVYGNQLIKQSSM